MWTARLLLRLESIAWLCLGILLIAGGLVVLAGGGGLPGIIHSDDPGFAPSIGGIAAGVGTGIVAMALWGVWTARSMRRQTRRASISALLFCSAWIVIGVAWIRLATTPIPGVVTIAVNGAILVVLTAPSSSRAVLRDRRADVSIPPVGGAS